MREITEQLQQLKLEAFVENLEKIIDQYPEARAAILNSLKTLTQAELASRQERTINYRIREAKFQQIQTVETFDFDYNPSTLKLKNRYLKLLGADLTTQGLCALFVGSAGLGKTHLARALGYRLCQQGRRVLFTSMGRMTLELVTAESNGNLKKVIDRYIQPTLLILDEVGYVGLREIESNLVFQIISARHDERRPTAVTTNRPFGEWNQIFHNDAIAHAILDRLAERSEVFLMEGKSYRETHHQSLKS